MGCTLFYLRAVAVGAPLVMAVWDLSVLQYSQRLLAWFSICCDVLQAFNFARALTPFSPTFDRDNSLRCAVMVAGVQFCNSAEPLWPHL